MDVCEFKRWARAEFFARDRDITLQDGRTYEGGGAAALGLIALWSGSVASIPSGWSLCDGTGGTPDLTDRFLVGAGDSYAVDATGGAQTHSHTYSFTTSQGTNATDTALPEPAGPYDASDTHRHNESDSVDSRNHRPPYYALAYIQRTA